MNRYPANLNHELVDLEKKYWQAIKDGDVETMLSLTDNPSLVAGASGVASFDREAMEKMIKAASYTLQNYEFLDDDFKVRMLGEDAAVVAYKVREDMTVDNETLSFEAAETSTWVRRDGKWVCALHTESIAGDPFGRDKVQSAKGM